MKLSKLYSNNNKFETILFKDGLNIVIADIMFPKDKNKSSHSIGKSMLVNLIDFALLGNNEKITKCSFLCDNGFIFFIEIANADKFITIRRTSNNSEKIYIHEHETQYQDLSKLEFDKWKYKSLTLEKAKTILDSVLDFDAIAPFSYRKIFQYLIRRQEDYQQDNIYRLAKYKGKDKDWKPIISKLFGFNDTNIKEHFELLEKIKELENEKKIISSNIPDTSANQLTKLDNEGLNIEKSIEELQNNLKDFDLLNTDKDNILTLVNEIDRDIEQLNNQYYYISKDLKKITNSINSNKFEFNINDVENVFNEVKILFPEQIKNDYNTLIKFNQDITKERKNYLTEEKKKCEYELKNINIQLEQNNIKRKNISSYLDSDSLNKYKELNNKLAELHASLIDNKRKKDYFEKLTFITKKIDDAKAKEKAIRLAIEEDVKSKTNDASSRYSLIRTSMIEIINKILNRGVKLDVEINTYGNINFKYPEIVDAKGATREADGTTYSKILTIAFDMSMLKSFNNVNFPKFLVHDGVMDTVSDPRTKEKLMDVITDFCDNGIQYIMTSLKVELPGKYSSDEYLSENTVLTLHDKDETGLLFKKRF